MSENAILDQIAYESDAGALTFKNVRYLLIRPETIIGFQKAMEEDNPDVTRDALFQGGFQGGYLSSKKYKALHNFSDKEVIDFMMTMGAEIGWGRFVLDLFDRDRKALAVTVRHSPFAQAYGPSNQGVCHLIRGVVSGLASVLFDAHCAAAEVECRAKGDERCRFVVSFPPHPK